MGSLPTDVDARASVAYAYVANAKAMLGAFCPAHTGAQLGSESNKLVRVGALPARLTGIRAALSCPVKSLPSVTECGA